MEVYAFALFVGTGVVEKTDYQAKYAAPISQHSEWGYLMAGNGVELIWEGKRKEVERVPLPFQRVDIINESRATRRTAPLFSTANPRISPEASAQPLHGPAAPEATPDRAGGWRNKLIWGDNKYVLASLIEGDSAIGLGPLAGKVDLIYIDPPFATGADFSFTARIGDDEFPVPKEQSVVEEKAYRDTWGQGPNSYLQMMYERLTLLRQLLAPTAGLYLHCDSRMSAPLRLIMDELFGGEGFRNEIVWRRSDAHNDVGQGARFFGRIHDSILYYTKSDQHQWNPQFTGLPESTVEKWYRNVEEGTGRRYNKADLTARKPGGNTRYEWKGVTPPPGRYWAYSYDNMLRHEREGRLVYSASGMPYMKRYLDESRGVSLQDWWDDISMIRGINSEERAGYATQKPEALLERVLKVSSDVGDLVLDCFSGSGTTMAVAEKLGRRWIGCDLGRFAIHTSRKRLLEIPECRPFEVLNLGRYQRRYWQGAELGEQVQEYLRFIVELYHAQPLLGFVHLHGRKGDRVVHVGATDAPVTVAEVRAALEECQANGFRALDVLGWEWEMGLNAMGLQNLQREHGVEAHLFHIPHEVMDKRAVAAGDVHFYEAAYVEATPQVDGRTVQVELTDFLVAIDDYIREKVGDKVKKWSDWIDYWAVDFDYNGDTFHNQWQAYRTRKEPKLEMLSGAHTWAESGRHQVLVKVVDIFGNDTTALLKVEL